ncbi:hypothetical protein ERO13_D05G146300v2 [Gossypium hirsutum]|uniref:TLC domain-containing protein n=2 Tax=Gossypium TaxID=3633 RepID=A0A5J5RD86_GOSBA|nr:hypothetical protein ES319_D05G149300v1 [Gossypium barbadense]KAB2029241.1 hypothetical protein ES319_D05G149300v1 [Gossypium barbadense]KAG4146255.1 hypothetical protein ERO13_D05G146300v2 [Gossypium hirsutum]KAG4146256.1 hypothetical protein ERO13_D05G146300v2 [Gossypium hirsutum]KJB57144.1 hypothetical protein B456_009G150200 [Gossypium raimondii]
MAAVPKQTTMAIKSYKNQAQMLVKNYLLADPFAPYTSILGGILACKVVSLGYFFSDLAMTLWQYPALGGIEYVIHHLLSGTAVAYSMFTGEAQLYTYMVLISEVTTPEIHLRWYLDTAGMKRSTAYLINGVVIFIGWLIARVLLFGYMFYHVYLHYDQVIKMHAFGFVLVFGVPSALGILNLMWFGKIIKGLAKTLAKRRSWTKELDSEN